MLVLFKLYGLYDRDVKRISHSTVDDLPWLFHATVIGALLLWLYSRSTPMGRLDFAEMRRLRRRRDRARDRERSLVRRSRRAG